MESVDSLLALGIRESGSVPKGHFRMHIVLTLMTYLVSDLQNPSIKIPIWQDTHMYETQISGGTVLHKVYEVHVVYKQGPTGVEPKIKFVEEK